MSDKLVDKVRAVNKAHACGMEIYAQLTEALRPLMGEKIVTAQNTLLKKVEKLIPELPYRQDLRVVLDSICLPYSLAWRVSAYEDAHYSCLVYVGILDDGKLINFNPPFKGRTDYTEQEVRRLRMEVEEAKRKVQAAQDAVGIFTGAYD